MGERPPSQRVWLCRRPNPTAYEYSYLWTVHTLFFWWREFGRTQAQLGLAPGQGQPEGQGEAGGVGSKRGALVAQLSPCYLNKDNPLAVVPRPPRQRQGGYFLVADVSSTGMDDVQFCKWPLLRGGCTAVALTPI